MNLDKVLKDEKEIDLKNIYKFFIRNKNSLFQFSTLGVVLSFLTPLFIPKLWMGEFQIVLQDVIEKQGLSNNINELKGLISGSEVARSSLETQVEILTSPSVLINIFNFVKDEKKKEDISYDAMSFRDWKTNLKVELKDNTSVLNLSYKDNDKSLIIPVLNKISQKYVLFNTEKKSKQIKEELNFNKSQIDLFKKISVSSYQAAQQFGIENDLFFDIQQEGNSLFSSENERVKKTNLLRKLNEQLKRIELIDKESDKLFFLTRNSENRIYQINPFISERLDFLDDRLAELRLVYKDNDILIKETLEERNELKGKLKKDIIGFLESEILITESDIKALQRPKNILIKFSELSNQAMRDMVTLQLLEDQSRLLSLELSKEEYPWDLITNPTLLPSPVSPRRRNYVLSGLFFGFVLGVLLSFYKNKKEDVFYEEEELENIFNFPVLDVFNKQDKLDIETKISCIASIDQISSLSNVGFIFEGQIQEEVVDLIKASFKKYMNLDKMAFSTDFIGTAKYQSQIIIIELGVTKKIKLLRLIKKIISNKISIVGILVLK